MSKRYGQQGCQKVILAFICPTSLAMTPQTLQVLQSQVYSPVKKESQFSSYEPLLAVRTRGAQVYLHQAALGHFDQEAHKGKDVKVVILQIFGIQLLHHMSHGGVGYGELVVLVMLDLVPCVT